MNKRSQEGLQVVTFNLDEITNIGLPTTLKAFTTGPLWKQDDTNYMVVLFENYGDQIENVITQDVTYTFDLPNNPLRLGRQLAYAVPPGTVGGLSYVTDNDDIRGLEIRAAFAPTKVIVNILAFDDDFDDVIPGNTFYRHQLVPIPPI